MRATLRVAAFLLTALLIPACTEKQFTFCRDPSGGSLTDSEACLYDFDRDGFWYVIFVRGEGLLAAEHRHAYGHHLFVQKGDLLFYSRCSGRGEVIDVMGQIFDLKRGVVFLCEIENGQARVKQLSMPVPRFRAGDEEQRARVLLELGEREPVKAFVSREVRDRMALEVQKAHTRKQSQKE
jgi:hypothetical protein